ncbi:carbohydrate ABC transporter permease [Histidinibacterium lentulum]|uniref:Carbohydrate ABC transporter permease n=1 Tax=Histidinibacterium lentulum TaxID=2480588 RepID=A0A3N2R655_9RHOB|nr:carbohydrate ABC transporter permease [Histidinibacterium lentulum]ROU02883.1 carbohydrate ABC transporter permease [Histidinibacterium lentulum]
MPSVTDRRSPGEWVQFAVGGLIVAAMFYPTVWMVLSAFKTNREIFRDPFGLPDQWLWGNFAEAWTEGRLGSLYLNSIIVTASAVTISVFFATAAAFAFSRLEFPFRRTLHRLMLIGLLLPPPVVAIPLFSILRDLDLLNTRWALILPGAAWSLSLTVFIMYGYFQQVRTDMEEAAMLEGANTWQIFRDISLPMVWPSMLTMAIVNTINIWNELMFALLFIVEEEKQTLPVGLIRFFGRYSTDYSMVFAALTITTLPILALYFLLQRHVIAGLSATAMD